MVKSGGEYKEQTVTLPVTVNGNSSVNVLDEKLFKWYEEDPEYFVEEVNIPTGYEKGSITPSSGVLEGTLNVPGTDPSKITGITVTSINKQIPISSKLKIVKELRNSDKMSEEYLESLEFKFQLDVNYNYPNRDPETEIIKLDKNNIEIAEDGKYIWVAESDIYKWYNKVTPTYTLKEIYRSDNQALLGEVSGDFRIGELKDGIYITEQKIENTTSPKEATIRLIKQLDEEDDKLNVLKSKNYRFIVKVTGTFSYDGGSYENQTLQLTYDGTSNGCVKVPEGPDSFIDNQFVTIDYDAQSYWDSSKIEWYGDNPEYTAEEYLIDEDINHTINPGHGYLTDIDPASPNKTVIITARNSYESKVGYLDLTKELENSEKCSSEYIKDLVFKFKIELFKNADFSQPIEQQIISLKPELEDTKWVWKYTGKYSWKVSEEAPYFRITEIDMPSGIEFDKDITKKSNEDQEGLKVDEVLPMITGRLIENPAGTFKEDENTDEGKSDEKKAGIKPTKVNFVNRLNSKSKELIIEKKVTDSSLNGKDFNFKVTISGTFEYDNTQYYNDSVEITKLVKGGFTESIGPIIWYGDESPSYVVEEEESEIAELVSMKNETGYLDNGLDKTIATFTNEPKKKGGYLTLTKKIVDAETNIVTDDIFSFDITIKKGKNNKDETEDEADEEVIMKQRVSLKADEIYKSDYIEWNASEEAPTYNIEEIEKPGFTLQEIQNKEGNLADDPNAVAIAYNKADVKTGTFTITKEVLKTNDLIKLPKNTKSFTFKFKVKIEGNFMIDDKMHYAEDPAYEMEASITLTKADIENEELPKGSYTSPTITWWGDEDIPTVTVEETTLPENWKQMGSSSNNNATLVPGGTSTIVVSNDYTPDSLLLTLELAGTVWEDEKQDIGGKNTLNSIPNGEKDDTEKGVKSVEVYVYKEDGSPITAYSDNLNGMVKFPILTDNEGNWKVPGIQVKENEKYYVQFVYDGQTYEATTFLAEKGINDEKLETFVEGSVEDYKKNRESYKSKSMAKEENREEVDNRILSISGNTAINGDGETIGTVSGKSIDQKDITNNINYEADVVNIDKNKKLKSELKTTDENGVALDLFKIRASTKQGGLLYPFDQKIHLKNENYDSYKAVYEYCRHINLGLVRRKTADLEVTKDLYSAKVIVDGKEQKYTFNQLGDLGKELYERELDYELGLYKTDYYYRAEMYKSNTELYNAMNNYYNAAFGKDPNYGAKDSELDVYLTYKINVYNSSENYIVRVNSVNDYYDSSFGEPINIETKELVDGTLKNVVTTDGVVTNSGVDNPNGYWQEVDKKEAGDGGIEYNKGEAKAIEWKLVETNLKSSDGRTYNKMTVDLNKLDLRLESGKKAEVYVTFKVKKDDIDGVKDSIILGEKTNIAELASYSTFYKDGKNAGKIDLDSAPANLNLEDHNDKNWYEDDTHIAPALKLYLKDEIRQINGIAWEDDKIDESNSTGDGKRGKNRNGKEEARIGGLTTELIEKITLPDEDGSTTTYDFLWPTAERLVCFGGKTIEEVTGFSSTIETLREETPEFLKDAEGKLITDKESEVVSTLKAEGYNVQEVTDNGKDGFAIIQEVGSYNFNSVPMGEFVVRFLYGNDKTQLDDQTKVTLAPPQALTASGSPYSPDTKLYTANYDNDEPESTPAVYNGQDFKSTTFKDDVLDNKAKDSESRRLEVMANSQTITSTNSSVLQSANNKEEIHTDLYRQYSMYADTNKINFDIDKESNEEVEDLGTKTIEDKGESEGPITSNIYGRRTVVYDERNISFGLIERPENNIILDKEISDIKLVTNDGNIIFDAIYNISYEVKAYEDLDNSMIVIGKIPQQPNSYLIAKAEVDTEKSVGIEQLQALNKNERKLIENGEKGENSGQQNFKFINVDTDILQGTTIQIEYLLTAINLSEIDYTSETLDEIANVAVTKQTTAKQEIKELASEVRQAEIKGELLNRAGGYDRRYLGNFYDSGNVGDRDRIVTTKIRQLVDYADNESIFVSTDNMEDNHLWRNTTITELAGSGIETNRILNANVIPVFTKLDKYGVEYIVKQDDKTAGKLVQRNNLLLSVDDDTVQGADVEGTIKSNAGFERKLVPLISINANINSETVNSTAYKADIKVTISKTVAAQDDADNLAYDNLSEIVKFENTVGRRDATTLVGNADPVLGEFDPASMEERDASATELITFTPPTGLGVKDNLRRRVALILSTTTAFVLVVIVIANRKNIFKKKIYK